MANRARTEALVVARIQGDQGQVQAREPAVAAAFAMAPPDVHVEVGGFAPSFQDIDVLVEHGLVVAEFIAI